MRRRPTADWRRRTLRAPTPGRLRCLVRGGRVLLLLLSATGCAIEPSQPVLLAPPAETTPGAQTARAAPPVISRFGEWRGEGGTARPARHAGIDIRGTTGTPVLAAADGVVLRTGSHAFAGRLIVLGHDADLVTVYYHLSAVEVLPGQAVGRGEVIGRVGMSGNATAPHLHFGVCRREGGLCGDWIDGGWEDPTRHWIAANPCFVSGQRYPPQDRRFTYPVPCQPAPTAGRPGAGAPGAVLGAPASLLWLPGPRGG